MMIGRLALAALALFMLWAAQSGAAFAAGKITAVASFSVLGDMVRRVGGDRIEVTTLVGPNSDAHVYQPTPGDAKTVANAKVLFVNGFGFEGWISRLERSSGFKGRLVVATDGVKPLEMDQEEYGTTRKVTDPHAWQSLANGKIYIANIRDALIAADPEGRATYEANAAKFMSDVDAAETLLKAKIAALPEGRRRIITTHNAFGYFGKTYGFEFISPEGVSTQSEASAQDVAKIIRQIKAQKIPAVFLENISDRRLLAQIARETGAKIGGTLYSDALSDGSGPASTYLDMFRHNIETLAAALSS